MLNKNLTREVIIEANLKIVNNMDIITSIYSKDFVNEIPFILQESISGP